MNVRLCQLRSLKIPVLIGETNESFNVYTSLLYFTYEYESKSICLSRGGPSFAIDEVLDCGFEVCEFELQILFYIHFRTNNFDEVCLFVCYFNSLSTFSGHLIPNPTLWTDISLTIQFIDLKIRCFIPFPRVFVRKWT